MSARPPARFTLGTIARIVPVLLMIGVGFNVALTWGFAAYSARAGGINTTPMAFPDGSAAWAGNAHWAGSEAWLVSPITEEMRQQIAPGKRYVPMWAKGTNESHLAMSVAHGWPRLAMMHQASSPQAGKIPDPEWAWTIRTSYVVGGQAHLPLRILPGGFAINSLCWFALAGVLWVGFGFATGRYRFTRGGCAVCGYSRVGLQPEAPCPECGTTVARAASPSAPPER